MTRKTRLSPSRSSSKFVPIAASCRVRICAAWPATIGMNASPTCSIAMPASIAVGHNVATEAVVEPEGACQLGADVLDTGSRGGACRACRNRRRRAEMDALAALPDGTDAQAKLGPLVTRIPEMD